MTAVSDCTLAVLAEEEFRRHHAEKVARRAAVQHCCVRYDLSAVPRLLGPLAKFHDAENSPALVGVPLQSAVARCLFAKVERGRVFKAAFWSCRVVQEFTPQAARGSGFL